MRSAWSSIVPAVGTVVLALGVALGACSADDPAAASPDGGPTTAPDASPRNDGGPTTRPNDVDPGDAPEPGAACSKIGQIYTRPCGNCGKASASCSPDRIVTGYGSCSDEPQHACKPGTEESNSTCGYCGTGSRKCGDDCQWVDQACSGEVTTPGRCKAGERVERDEGCPPGVKRPWTCSNACAWLPVTISCEEVGTVLSIGNAEGAVTSLDAKQKDERLLRLVSSSKTPCDLAGNAEISTTYLYLEVRNPNPTSAKVDLRVGAASGETTKPELLIAAYATRPDTTAAARKACINGTGSSSNCQSEPASSACLMGTRAITIPANGSVFVYVANLNYPQDGDPDPERAAAKRFKLSAKIVEL